MDKDKLLRLLRKGARRLLRPFKTHQEIDALYTLLYRAVHDVDQSLELATSQTVNAFAHQWESLQEGAFLLSDPWFREHVARILSEEELQLRQEWFAGKKVLDAGCGNGRWSYGFLKLGAEVTAVDVNPAAIAETRKAVAPWEDRTRFYVSALEELSKNLPNETYDLVFSWGVLHHCKSFSRALSEVVSFVKPGGVLYLYLYGRESMDMAEDLALFKERIRYNMMDDPAERYRFLLHKARGDKNKVHNYHDIYAPLINRRLEFDQVKQILQDYGFEAVSRTLKHTELFIRAVKGDAEAFLSEWALPACQPPYWFQRNS